jgi:polysaccharide export outer membrane protein
MTKRLSVAPPARPIRTTLVFSILLLGCNGANTGSFNYNALKNRCKGNFQLESGDVIRVNVWNEPNHSREQVLVRPDGKISLPLVGDVNAAGTTINQITRVIQRKVTAFVPNPRVDVSLVSARSYQIYVMGEVRRPGTFTPQSQVNVVQALSLAGGFTPFAKRNEMWIIWNSPKGEVRIPFNYEEVLAGKQLQQNLILCRGDTVLVP